MTLQAQVGCAHHRVQRLGGLAMGRGRSKAKQTKVARDLKYHSQDIDIERLAKELHGEADKNGNDDDFDPYAEGNYIPRR